MNAVEVNDVYRPDENHEGEHDDDDAAGGKLEVFHDRQDVVGRTGIGRQVLEIAPRVAHDFAQLRGRQVALIRDMTDTMYNSRRPPFVDHFSGTELVIEHIERYWCGTVTSDQFVGGEPFQFRRD